MTKLNILTCIQVCSTWSHGFLTSQPLWNSVRKQKMNYSTQYERICLWRVTLISASLHKEPCLRGKDSEAVSSWFFPVYFWVLVCGNFLFSCQTNYIDNKAIWTFLFLIISSTTRLKSGKLNGTQFIHTREIWYLVLQSWNILVAFRH